MHTPEIDRYSCNNKCHHRERLYGLRKHSPAEEKEADAAEDDGGRDPCLVRPFELRLLDPQDDDAEHGAKVKRVAGDAVKGHKGGELAHNAVPNGEEAVEHERVDRCKEEAHFPVAKDLVQFTGEATSGSLRGEALVLVVGAEANLAEYRGDIALLAGDVDESAGGKGGTCEGS